MQEVALLWLLVWNFVAFALMGVDKAKARQGRWRIPEKTLFLSAILGGSVGAMLGMSLFRHKTQHRRFRLGMPLILALQVLGLLALSWHRMAG
ncbi:MAG: DUF1294 domain-containing protein [Ruminiclostridium sp.]|jgi:uncharacterized membrane protein YsdA (DUF1294 family)|nr:DUF1294 domain-containing protein [Ruminiclostridium sp.]